MDEIANDKAFIKYIGKLNKQQATNEAYKYALACWSTHIQMLPTEALKLAKEQQRTIFEVEDRDIDEYFATFPESLKDLSSNTQAQIYNNVKTFYKRNGVELPWLGTISTKVKEENDYRLSTEEIRHAYKVCESVRNRAMILVEATSGCGTAEVLSIKAKDFLDGIDESGITVFHPTRAKTRFRYTTCCSPEATEAVLLWLKEYDGEYLFPLKAGGVKMVYKRLSEKAGFEKKYGAYAPFHSHGLRKWFNSTMSNADCPHDMFYFWSGRQENAVQKAYIQWDDARHLEVYKRYVEKLAIVNEIIVISNDEKVKELEKEIAELKLHQSEMKDYMDNFKNMWEGKSITPSIVSVNLDSFKNAKK